MASPLSPMIADFYMESFECLALQTSQFKPTCFMRYVDDTFLICSHELAKVHGFVNFKNSIHINIKFTMELQQDGQLPFPNVLVYKKGNGTLGRQVYSQLTPTYIFLTAAITTLFKRKPSYPP